MCQIIFQIIKSNGEKRQFKSQIEKSSDNDRALSVLIGAVVKNMCAERLEHCRFGFFRRQAWHDGRVSIRCPGYSHSHRYHCRDQQNDDSRFWLFPLSA